MKVIYRLKQVKKISKPVVILGVFDGMHQGHRRILAAAKKEAKVIRGKMVLLTFWPHPQGKESLYSLEHRLNLARQFGIDVSIVIKFDAKFSRIQPETFVKDILVDKIGVHYIYVGENFRFGKDARGDVKLLRDFSRRYNFELKAIKVRKRNYRPISSTDIRKLIKQGRLKEAEVLLTRPVSVLGTVIHGTSLARKLGFPTANINPHHEVLPPAGVYAVEVILENKKFKGVCFIGPKPTFIRDTCKGKLERQEHIEVHIFNFSRNIYGKNLEIQFVKRLRKVKKFPSPALLAQAVKKDIQLAKRLFNLP